MKLQTTVYLASLGVIFLSSCTEKAIRTFPQENTTEKKSVVALAEQTFASIMGGLRIGESNTVQTIDSIAADADKQLYLANFEGGGFLLFSSRDDGVETFGFSEHSNLQFADTLGNPILKTLFTNSAKMSGGTTVIIGPGGTTFDPNAPQAPNFPVTYYSRKNPRVEYEYPPSTYAFFCQSSPFNRYVKYNHPAGCGPIAIAGIFSHYRKQGVAGSWIDWEKMFSKYNGKETHWSLANDADLIHNVARMICDIQLYCHTLSTSKYTLSTPANVRGYLRRAGFAVTQQDYNPAELIPYLKETKAPVIMFGWSSPKSAHYWVIDGYGKQLYDVYSKTWTSWTESGESEYVRTDSFYFVHCSWGWRGDSNGWFNYGIFNPDNGHEEIPLPKSGKKNGGDYTKVEIFKIRPN